MLVGTSQNYFYLFIRLTHFLNDQAKLVTASPIKLRQD